MKVLLAVESRDLRLALDLFLKELPGVLVVGATCCTEGVLALLRSVEIDLVVLQWTLPGLPATELLDSARALFSPPRFLVLGSRAADEEAAAAAGADAFALIGDTPQSLLDALAALLPLAQVL